MKIAHSALALALCLAVSLSGLTLLALAGSPSPPKSSHPPRCGGWEDFNLF